jgi:HlyD family secretion protein
MIESNQVFPASTADEHHFPAYGAGASLPFEVGLPAQLRLDAPRRRRHWKLWSVAALLALGLLAFGVTMAREVPTGNFRTASVTRRDLRVTVTASGTLEALTTVAVGSELGGRVLTLNAAENDTVKRGQLLAELDPQDLRLAVAQADAELKMDRAAVLQALATVQESTSGLERNRKLRGAGLIDEQAWEASKASHARALAGRATARAKVQLSEAALALSRSRLAKATISSPIDGVVLSRLVEPGQTLTAGFQTPLLFRLAKDLTQLQLKASVTEADIGRLSVGQEASFQVEAYPDRNFVSRVVSLANEAEVKQGVVSFRATLSVDNAQKLLRPGMTCTVQIVATERRDRIVVPNAALRFEPENAPAVEPHVGSRRRVWLPSGSAARSLEVDVGASDGSFTELVNPTLPVGARVIVEDGDAT